MTTKTNHFKLSSSSILIILLVIGQFISVSTSNAQTRAFLFNNGYNYLLADKEKAVEQFTKAIEIDSNFSAAYFYRGIAEFKLGHYEQAINDFTRVNQLDTNLKVAHMYKGFAYRQLGDNQKSLESLSTYLDSQNELSALDYNMLGKAKMKAGDLDGAIDNFAAALTESKNESQHYYLFLALFGNRDYDEALDQINLAIVENNDFYGYYINRGNTLFMTGNFNKALVDYNYAITLEPEVPDSYYLRARTLDTLGRHEKAILDFSRAIELNPTDGTYYSKRGNARFSSGNKRAACMDWTIAGNLGYYEDFDKIKSLCD
ncbi:MAG: tetratricopeptide repeat protein [Bacteroidota bacterium]